MNRPVLKLSAVAILVAICTFFGPTGPVTAAAQETHLPIVGRLFLTVGADVRAGPVLDWSDDLTASPTVGPRVRGGFHHIISERLSMNAEAALGATYLAAHPMAPDGDGDAQVAFDWSIAVLGRYMAIGPLSGWTLAGGPYYRSTALSDGSLLQFGLDGRVGYNFWTDDERFLILEFGLHAPLIEGISVPQHAVDPDQAMDNSWTLPSASLGIQWAF